MKIFISYRRNDTADMAGRLYGDLKKKFSNAEIFFDANEIPSGAELSNYIREKIKEADLLLAIIGWNWTDYSEETKKNRIFEEYDWVKEELLIAIKNKTPIMPVLAFGAPFPSRKAIPIDIRHILNINSARLRRDPDYESDFEELSNSISLIIQRNNTRAAEKIRLNNEKEKRIAEAILIDELTSIGTYSSFYKFYHENVNSIRKNDTGRLSASILEKARHLGIISIDYNYVHNDRHYHGKLYVETIHDLEVYFSKKGNTPTLEISILISLVFLIIFVFY